MSSIDINPRRKKRIQVIHKRLHVDLTPMVDLGFLLITFFMLSTTLAQANTTDIVMPKDSEVKTNIKESAVLTLMPVRNNEIEYFEGRSQFGENIKHCNCSQLRSVIQNMKNKVQKKLGSRNQTVIIIMPGAESTYENFVDIIDEIKVNDIQHYFITNDH